MAEKTPDIGAIVREVVAEVLPAAVKASVMAMREADEEAARDAEMARLSAEKEAEEREAGRPPRRRDVDKAELDKAAGKFRAGSSVKALVHRRFRAKAWREGDDTSEPARMGAVHPDEVVLLPIEPEAIGEGQSPREMAHAMLRGMFELAA